MYDSKISTLDFEVVLSRFDLMWTKKLVRIDDVDLPYKRTPIPPLGGTPYIPELHYIIHFVVVSL